MLPLLRIMIYARSSSMQILWRPMPCQTPEETDSVSPWSRIRADRLTTCYFKLLHTRCSRLIYTAE